MRSQRAVIAEFAPPAAGDDWTFLGADTRQLTHCFHDYPARMIPQVAGKLLDQFGADAQVLFDPYCGTGTSLVEGLVRGLNVVGTDLNPLARLISTAKTTPIPLVKLDREIKRMETIGEPVSGEYAPPSGIRQLDFWFQPAVSKRLAALREFIDSITSVPVRRFFQVAFSETVRDCSNTRNEEFKLYRYDEARLARFRPEVFAVMRSKLERNREGAREFSWAIDRTGNSRNARILDIDTVNGVPAEAIKPESVDLVVTSPPYGDSRTTVAYGQYSRLSAAWLGLEEPHGVDRRLMGGTSAQIRGEFPSEALNDAIGAIDTEAPNRAREVTAFYDDLLGSITNVAATIRPGGHACYVVGNRRVKGVVLPTDLAVADFFASVGFCHVDTFHRSIPNKRMPLKNSPGNIAGETAATMSREYIVVMKKGER